MRRLFLFLLAIFPATAGAQVVTGFVIDSTTRQGIVNATVTVRSAGDSRVLAAGLSDSAGQFRLRLSQPDTVVVNVRRIGFQPLGTAPRFVPAEGTVTLAFEMGRVPTVLDTMRTEGRRSLTGLLFRLTSGQEWYTRHMRAGKGFFTSSAEIRLSGLLPCDYFGRVDGLKIVRTAGALPSLPCYDGLGQDNPTRYVVPIDNKVPCMQAFVDKKYRLIGMNDQDLAISIPGARPRWIPLQSVRGIEVFMNYQDVPDDFSIPPVRVPPTIRGSGAPNPATVDMIAKDSRFCAVLLVWTAQYWNR
jgi:hypothetical protein